jgi:hypothetical protein
MKDGSPPESCFRLDIREFFEGNPGDVSNIGRNQRQDTGGYEGEKTCGKSNEY